MSDDTGGFKAPPIPGYRDVSSDQQIAVASNKRDEERLLRTMDDMKQSPDIDQRWLAIARTHIEEGFMALNRSIFKPGRVKLPGDGG